MYVSLKTYYFGVASTLVSLLICICFDPAVLRIWEIGTSKYTISLGKSFKSAASTKSCPGAKTGRKRFKHNPKVGLKTTKTQGLEIGFQFCLFAALLLQPEIMLWILLDVERGEKRYIFLACKVYFKVLKI